MSHVTQRLDSIEQKVDDLHDKVDHLHGLMHRILNMEHDEMAAINDLATQLAQSARDNDDAFTAMNTADESRAARLKAQIEALKAQGNVDPAVIAELTGVVDSLTGTKGKMVNAAILANTDAAGDVPPPIAATVPTQ